jgi:hypothetical protein
MDTFVIKIKNRFFSEYKNNRINTAWSLAGAKIFRNGSDDLLKLEKVLNDRKIKYERAFIQEVEQKTNDTKEAPKDVDYIPFTIPVDGKKREQLLLRFKLPLIQNLEIINSIVVLGYRKTYNKFSVSFNGSKGYLSNIEITCEGFQKEENRIFVEKLRNKDGSLKNIMVNLFYSYENGVRLSTGDDEPQVIAKEEKKELVENSVSYDIYSDLPF